MGLAFFPRRMVHLDFHTSPHIPDVGADFDPDAFAETFAAARVDSVTVFAKCHHGHLYYTTDRPERHPGLKPGLDLLGGQIEALHKRGIKAPIYLSVQVDEYAANLHPEWCAIDPASGRLAKWAGVFEAGWQILDMSGPYQDYFAEQLAEVLRLFAPVDGIFMDMCWDQPSVSKWALEKMTAKGLDPRCDTDRNRHAREVALGYMERYSAMIDAANKKTGPVATWINSRPRANLVEEKRFFRHVEIECLPTGGWGYAYFPYVARLVRPMGLPTLSHTGRFHRSWGDFGGIKPRAALLYECASILSQGMTSGVGDQLPPRGVPDRAAYDLIGSVYRHIEACEPWVEGMRPASEAAVLVDPNQGDQPGPWALGCVRMLQELRVQFDLIPAGASLKGYRLVIVPEALRADARLAKALQRHLADGGALVVSGEAALGADGAPLFPELGVRKAEPSPFKTAYLRAKPGFGESLPATDLVTYEPGLRLTAARGAETLACVVEPYFDRDYRHFCSHAQTPPSEVTSYAGVLRNGRALVFAFPLFTAYGKQAYPVYKQLLGAALDTVLPDRMVRDGGPAHLEATVVKKGARTAVHLISFIPSSKGCERHPEIVEDPIPLVDMPLSVRLSRKPKRAVLAPTGAELPLEWDGARAEVRVTLTAGHGIVVFE